MIRQILAALALAAACPAAAATFAFTGTQMNDTPPRVPSSLCGAGQVLVSFSPQTAISTGSSNFGNFAASQRHCLTPPPGVYTGGVFDYAFEAGDMFFGTYSGFFQPGDVAGVLNNNIELIVQGGTGRFLGATGVINGIGTLDTRVPRTVSTLTVNGTLNLPAVPEPATWATMILGFGLVGAVMRRRPRASHEAGATSSRACL